MRLKKTNEIAEIDKNVDCKITNCFSDEIFFFIVNFNLKILTIVSKIVRRFRENHIAIKIKKNHYSEKHTEKEKNDFLKKIIKQTIESTDFSIIKKLLAFHQCRKHHNFLFEKRKHFSSFDEIIF